MGCPAWHPSSRRHRRVAHGRGRCRTLWETDSRFISARARAYTHVRVVFALAFSPTYRIAIPVAIDRRSRSLSLSLSFFFFFSKRSERESRDFSKREPVYRVFYLSLRNRRLFRNARRSRREEEPTRRSSNGKKEKKKRRNAEETSVSWMKP